MRSCLIGQSFLSWLLIGYFLSACHLEVRGNPKDGEYGSACTMNSDCQLGFVCLQDTCACDSSYTYDFKEGICKKVCKGSSDGLTRFGNTDNQYNRYKTRYTNCSFVDGNLELTLLEKPFDLSFLEHIEEVDGYVLVVDVYSSYLHLRKLQIIRGNTLYKDKYSLFVALNYHPQNESEGLMELQFTSLKEITTGHAYFYNNNLLCHVNTVRWDDIYITTEPKKAPVAFISNSTHYKRPCPSCPSECYNKATSNYHCWGSGPSMCQELNYIKEVCSEACDGRCFGPLPNQCCHAECAAGCTSQKRTDCMACRNFKNDKECVPFCPRMQKYDQNKMKFVDNPAGRYTFKSLCVKQCPDYLLRDNDVCVLKCPEGKVALKETNECIKCEGTCPKKCLGIDDQDFLSSHNIKRYKGCTVVEGNIKIVKVSFNGDPFRNITGIKPEDLWLLKDIKVITGFLKIQETPPEVKNVSFLADLEVIHGRNLMNGGIAFTILHTSIESLGLSSLREISNGNVIVFSNSQLCYIDSMNFTSLFAQPEIQLTKELKNRDQKTCDKKDSKIADSKGQETEKEMVPGKRETLGKKHGSSSEKRLSKLEKDVKRLRRKVKRIEEILNLSAKAKD